MPSDFPARTLRDAPFAVSFDAADEIVSAFFARGSAPSIAYGIVRDGQLVHTAGFGHRSLGGTAPDERTVYRIASMSKSFTASAIMLLRDSGALALDDPAVMYVSELAGWSYGSADAALVTIRNLLTMTAGFPTDDPWGDRQQGLPFNEFSALLSRGIRFNWTPATRFEYSNLGYAILGRVVSAASKMPYDEFIRTRLLAPLGMRKTGFAATEFSTDELAIGYRHGPDGWQELPFDPYGAFAPMGGFFSTVTDLAAWAAGFAAAFPPDGAPPGTHPVAAASRRQMQLPQAVTSWRAPDRIPAGPPGAPAYYGFGLFVDEDPAFGRIVSHSGGYPGFGSNMRWHPATGIGVIALGNGTYAPMYQLADLVMRAILPQSPSWHVALAPVSGGPVAGGDPVGGGGGVGGMGAGGGRGAGGGPGAAGGMGAGGWGADGQVIDGPSADGQAIGGPWPETLAAAEAVNKLLADWDDADADALFCENVKLDAPYAERLAAVALVRDRLGGFTADQTRPAESDTPAHRRWWLTGPRGTVQAQIQLNPEHPPRVQSLAIAVPPAAGSVLARTLEAVLAWWNTPGTPVWPESVKIAPTADAGLIARRLRMAAVWAGRVTPGAYRGGDGNSSVAVELSGEHAKVTLSLLIQPATGYLRQTDITL